MIKNLVIVVLAHSRLKNIEKTVINFFSGNTKNVDLVIQIDNSDSEVVKSVIKLKSKYNFKLEKTGGIGHDLSYKNAFINYEKYLWKWIVNDSIIIKKKSIEHINSVLDNKFDCYFICEKNYKFSTIPLWYATRTGWVIYKNSSIDRNYIKKKMFKNFPQLMFYKKQNINFSTISLKLEVNKSTPSYWINSFWETWFVDFVDALKELGYHRKYIKKVCINHSKKNLFFSFFSMTRWPSSFFKDYNENYFEFMSSSQIMSFKIFKYLFKNKK